MTASAQQKNSGPKTKANHYMREAGRNGKSLRNASAQRIGHNLRAVLQLTVKPRVGAEHQTTICLQATSAQRTDHSLMVVLQRAAMPRVVTYWQTNLSPQATST